MPGLLVVFKCELGVLGAFLVCFTCILWCSGMFFSMSCVVFWVNLSVLSVGEFCGWLGKFREL